MLISYILTYYTAYFITLRHKESISTMLITIVDLLSLYKVYFFSLELILESLAHHNNTNIIIFDIIIPKFNGK